ncbi:hypothetical protein V6N12_018359 [Hibiscus sabdariffa]|uniref:Uncharacterized protein n=1 Tax=Hibiscus sabdariffa TaxID=183260 RepID=A0ABR2BQR6_9ROSI
MICSAARIDLGKTAIDKEVVEKVWDRIAPGLASKFDSPSGYRTTSSANIERSVSRIAGTCLGYACIVCLSTIRCR